MNVLSMSCASCGAPLQIPPDIDQLTCSHCGTSLMVQRGEGYAALKIAENISKAFQEVGTQTQSSIREGTQVTQLELKRLQLSQELSSLQMQLSSVQAELRALERQKKSRQIKRQLKELYAQEASLLQRTKALQTSINSMSGSKATTVGPQNDQIKEAKAKKTKSNPRLLSSCVISFLVFAIVGVFCGVIAQPLDEAIFNVSSDAGSSTGPLFGCASIAAFILGVIVFIYFMNPNAAIWQSVKNELSRKKTATQQAKPNTTDDPKKSGLE